MNDSAIEMRPIRKPLLNWGSHSLYFDLPACGVQIRGLSADQFTTLQSEYRGFIHKATSQPESARVYAHKLGQPVSIKAEDLIRDGQYAPIKNRSSEGIELTGVNFVAQINDDADYRKMTLGVAQEHEMASSMVIENFLRIYSAHRVLSSGGILLHSAGLVFNDKAYIFVGRSNVGKTTLTRKAHQCGATVLSDDINLLLPQDGGYHAYAVPFTGEFGRTLHHKHDAKSYPVTCICLLEQADSFDISKVDKSSAVARLWAGAPFVNEDEYLSADLFDNLTALVDILPAFRLQLRRNDPVDVIIKAIDGQLGTA